MNNTLEHIWELLLEDDPKADNNEKTRAVRRTVCECSDKLHNTLTREQVELLEDYMNSIHELHGIFEEKAFVKGVRFATNYLLEALCTE